MKVGVLGSCRIKDPLKAVGAELRYNSSFGHIHNPLEILQALDLMAGGRQAPAELLDLMNLRHPERIGRPVEADVFVVEVSSIRLVQFGDWQLQIHRFRDLLQAHGVGAEDLKILYEDMDRWRRHAATLAAGLPGWPATVLRETEHREMSAADIEAALGEIADRLTAPVLFVGPIVEAFGKRPTQRVVLRDALQAWSRRSGRPVLDPTLLVHDKDLLDLGHYRPEALPRLGEEISAAAARILALPPR